MQHQQEYRMRPRKGKVYAISMHQKNLRNFKFSIIKKITFQILFWFFKTYPKRSIHLFEHDIQTKCP
jgi:hypothetical protein